MYEYYKAISTEMRGLAVEQDVCIVTATQFNRGGASSTDPDMDDISESFAVNFGADFIAALVVTDELKEQSKVLCKQLKNRYDNMDNIPKFVIGFNRNMMKFYDVKEPQSGFVNSASDDNKIGDFKF